MKVFKPINSLDEIPRFGVGKQPLFNAAGIQIPKMWGLTRDDTDQVIGICSDLYRPIQIEEMIDTIVAASGVVNADIQHIGYTENIAGSTMVIQSKIGDIGLESDPVDGYLYTVIDHRGKSSNKIIPSTIRIHCTNAFHLVKRENRYNEVPVLRHSMSFDDRVIAFRENIKFNIEYTKNFASIARSLRGERFTKDDMVKMVNALMPIKGKESTRSQTKRDKIISKFREGIGTEGANKWDALNAVTEFESYQKTSSTKFIRNLSMSTLSTKAFEYLKAA